MGLFTVNPGKYGHMTYGKIRLKLEILNCRQKQKAVGDVNMANLSVEPQV
jgi:hypothetical protein